MPQTIEPPSRAPELSVLITVLNGERWIHEQLNALARQRATVTWEVVIADNGCTDGTMDIVRNHATSFPVPLRTANARTRPGICHGRNIAATAALGRKLAFCDCDDIVGDGWVAAAAAALEHADIVGGICRELTEPFRTDSPVLVNGPFKASFGYSFPGGNFAIHRDTFFAIGGFDESMPPYGCDDVEFSIRANDFGARIRSAREMCIYFRPTTSIRRRLRKAFVSGIAEYQVWMRHQYRYINKSKARNIALSIVLFPFTAVSAYTRGRPAPRIAGQAAQLAGNLFGAASNAIDYAGLRSRLLTKLGTLRNGDSRG